MTNEEIVNIVKDRGYLDVKLLEDGSIIALGDLLYTRAIYLDIDLCGYGRRYCFSDRSLATNEFQRMKSSDEEPVGFIAQR